MRKIVLHLTILLVLSIMVSGCVDTGKGRDKEGIIISGTGTVKFIGLEGGFYGIIGDDGKNYNPINLDQEFQIDGLRVRFEAKIRYDIVSIRMWGSPIEIMGIEKR